MILDRGFWWPDQDIHCRAVVLDEVDKLREVSALCVGKQVAVQAGGNVGVFPRWLAQVFGAVYTFEPDQENFECLCKNVPERNVFKFPAALAAQHRGVDLARQADNVGAHQVDGLGPIPTLRIDDLCLSACDLIYLDIEGCEWLALLGGAETINAYRPVIAFEDKGLSVKYGAAKGHIELDLAKIGYRVHSRPGNDVVMVP